MLTVNEVISRFCDHLTFDDRIRFYTGLLQARVSLDEITVFYFDEFFGGRKGGFWGVESIFWRRCW